MTRHTDEPEPKEKQKEKGGTGSMRLAAVSLIKRIARRAGTIVMARHAPITAAAYQQAAAVLDDTLDSMNPYWEPDAHLTGIEGDDYNTPPPTQDYCSLQL